MSVQTIAVVGAMEQEIELLRESMADVKHVSLANSRHMKANWPENARFWF